MTNTLARLQLNIFPSSFEGSDNCDVETQKKLPEIEVGFSFNFLFTRTEYINGVCVFDMSHILGHCITSPHGHRLHQLFINILEYFRYHQHSRTFSVLGSYVLYRNDKGM